MEPSFMDELLIQVHNMISRSKADQSELEPLIDIAKMGSSVNYALKSAHQN